MSPVLIFLFQYDKITFKMQKIVLGNSRIKRYWWLILLKATPDETPLLKD
jgi:hypothetical protein